MNKKAELIVDEKALLGEGPTWDESLNVLYWVDIMGCRIHRYSPAEKTNETIDAGQEPGAVVVHKGTELIGAMQHGFYHIDFDRKTFEPVADPEEHLPGNRFNDGKVDPAGRFWAGTMAYSKQKDQAALYCLEPDLSWSKKVDHIGISNGLAWSEDGTVMYFIDTPALEVSAFDYDIETGGISNRRPVITFSGDDGRPDGMTIDKEGMLWIAHFRGWKVSRWNPETGECLEEIDVPAGQVTSCVFGGKDLTTLYITTARNNLSEEQIAGQPHAGGLFAVQPGVTGTLSRRFGF
ncbi:SMP-30/gluconolactonase/LRE family protein [Salibacterium halotolerans]|uniref:Regucalcin n=1 Tax=Salibacterium halotolerans TaxID=1884432 RepID=A0A1I5L6A8_9BACI|nr:SMP-30/gluconolactonase/LRE family protein [Salibacterium halotolerans]SFO92869.1 Sugar lactone lactonase YvrE [Salibacterium halotolerans]